MTDDETLVKLTLSGDKNAYGQLVHKYQSAVYGLCYHLVGNFADAQDLAQEAFVLAYQDLHKLREPAKFASWLNQLTGNVCRMWLRKKSDNALSIEDASELDFIDRKALSPLEKLEREEMRQFIRKAIDSLSERNRLAVTLFYMDGLSYKDIGDFLGVPVNTVKSRLHEARKQRKNRRQAKPKVASPRCTGCRPLRGASPPPLHGMSLRSTCAPLAKQSRAKRVKKSERRTQMNKAYEFSSYNIF